MPKFQIFCDQKLIGESDLEGGDPSMGVAFGVLVTNENYARIRDECRGNHKDQSHLRLSAKLRDQKIECAGVGILDYSEDAGLGTIEVNVLGISKPTYAALFPGRE